MTTTGRPGLPTIERQPVTNNLAVMTPYGVTFRGFSPELAQVLDGFAASPHGFIVKAINVQPASAARHRRVCQAPPGQPPATPVPGRGGLQTVLNEQLLRVTLAIER